MTKHTPFKLVYGQEEVVPMDYIVPRLRIAAYIDMDESDVFQDRFVKLLEMEENHFIAYFYH